eukprot:c17325_g1_i2 orf=148-345(+)
MPTVVLQTNNVECIWQDMHELHSVSFEYENFVAHSVYKEYVFYFCACQNSQFPSPAHPIMESEPL